MNTWALEKRIDDEMVKMADPILGRPKTLAGSLAQTGLYFVPVVGSGLSLADGINDFIHGRWKSGLGNTALGIGSLFADIFSAGTAGSTMRGAIQAGKLGIRGAAAAAKAGKLVGAAKGLNAAKDAGMIGRNIAAIRAGRAAIAGKGIGLAQRATQGILGAKGYGQVVNTGRRMAQFGRDAKSFMGGYRTWKPVAGAIDFAKQSPWMSRAMEYGRKGMEAYRRLPGYIRHPANIAGSLAAYSYIPGMEYYANLRYGGSPLVKLLGAEGSMMIPQNMKKSVSDAHHQATDIGSSMEDRFYSDESNWRGGLTPRVQYYNNPYYSGQNGLNGGITGGWRLPV